MGGGRPGLPVPNSPYGLCERKAALNEQNYFRARELCESRGGRPGLPVPYGLRGRKATLNLNFGRTCCVDSYSASRSSFFLVLNFVGHFMPVLISNR